MPQIDVDSHVPRKSTDTANENLLIDNIQELVKKEKCETKEELLNENDLQSLNEDNNENNSEASSPRTKNQTSAKRVRFQKLSKGAKKKSRKSLTPREGQSNREFLTEQIIKEEFMDPKPYSTRSRSVYTCKFCQKDFSSAFILCLHVQIHEKVNSVSNCDDQKTTVTDTLSSTDKIAKDKTEETGSVGCSSSDSSGTSDGGGSSDDSGCSRSIKTESIEECEISPSLKTEHPTIVKNNFVANLKKNLSLAMNRKL